MAQTDVQIREIVQDASSIFDGVVFAGLMVAGVLGWVRTRSAVSAWFAGMFASLTFVVVAGAFQDPADPVDALSRITIAVLALFPFCLYRFTRSFARGTSWIDVTS